MKRKNMPMGRSTRHFFTLLALAVIAAMVGFAFHLVREEESQFSLKIEGQHREIEASFRTGLQDRTDKLGAALDLILLDPRFAGPMRDKDRAALLGLSSPLFERLRDRFRVTHLYFHGPDRVNLLRVHQPGRFGDRIDRPSALAAQSTGRTASGVELGPLGILTLRIVAPLRDGETLLGYVELGEEIDDLIARTDATFGGEGYLLLDKGQLQPEGFAAGMKMLGRVGLWERFADFVVANRSDSEIDWETAGLLARLPRDEPDVHRVVQLGRRSLGFHLMTLTDAAGQIVGRHLMLLDLTSQHARLRSLLRREGGLLLAITLVAILSFHWLLRRREEELDRSYASLERVHKEQAIIAGLLHIGHRPLELGQKLEEAIALLVEAPWLDIEAKGAIFLAEGKDRLRLAAHRGLPPELQNRCSRVPFGHCICGRAALERRTLFCDHLDARHEAGYIGTKDHGHYGLPLIAGERLLGVLNLYVEAGHRREPSEEAFLDSVAHTLATLIERGNAEERLRLASRAMEAAYNGIVLTEAGGGHTILYINPAFERITGYSPAEVLGRVPDFLCDNDKGQPALQTIRDAIRERREGNALLRNYRKDGSLFWNDLRVTPVTDMNGEVSHFVGIINDVTNEHRYLEELEHQATHDGLTGLYNRNLLHDRLTQAIAMAERGGHQVGVLYLDLDRFKLINDSLGHAAGDELLRFVARHLREDVREGDTLARYGGDEFVIVLPQLDSPKRAAIFAERILARTSEVLEISGEEAPVSLSLGAAIYPRDGQDADTLIRNAGAAMSKARKEGSGYRFFTDDLSADASERLRLERDLRRGLKGDELLLHYQPQAETPGGRIFGVEALVRWRHPQEGLVPPYRFIPLAEETGLILPLGEWVLREACRQAVAWRDAGLPPLILSVNLSVHQIEHSDLPAMVKSILEETGLEPERLELEITESLFMERLEAMEAKVAGLKALGCRLTLDDFGTGYSSLSALKRLAFDKLKIDRGFITDIPQDSGNAVIAQTIIAMADALGLEVIAEGVETAAQLQWLSAHGCNQIQGYYLSRPLPAEELEALLRGR